LSFVHPLDAVCYSGYSFAPFCVEFVADRDDVKFLHKALKIRSEVIVLSVVDGRVDDELVEFLCPLVMCF